MVDEEIEIEGVVEAGKLLTLTAAEAIDGNASRDKFFIQAEGFDPHEPWFNPEPYRSMYGPYRDDVPCWLPCSGAVQCAYCFSVAGSILGNVGSDGEQETRYAW